MNRNRRITLSAINGAAYLVTILMNYLANAVPFNGQDSGAVSDKYYTLFTPAGFTFAIWGVIYLALGAFVVYQIIESFRENQPATSFVDRIGFWFIISCIANSFWIYIWHHEILWLSIFVMLLLFASLLNIYLRLDIGSENSERPERFFVHLPFSLYLGWISVATIANVSAFLVSLEWSAWGIPLSVWAVLMILIAAALGVFMAVRRRDIFYTAVIAWASFGIWMARKQDEPSQKLVMWVGILVMVGMLGTIAWQTIKKETYIQ